MNKAKHLLSHELNNSGLRESGEKESCTDK